MMSWENGRVVHHVLNRQGVTPKNYTMGGASFPERVPIFLGKIAWGVPDFLGMGCRISCDNCKLGGAWERGILTDTCNLDITIPAVVQISRSQASPVFYLPSAFTIHVRKTRERRGRR